MEFISLDIRVGGNGGHVEQQIQSFHEDVVRQQYPTEPTIKRLGLAHSSPIEHRQIVHQSGTVVTLLNNAVAETQRDGVSKVDLCLLDFSRNSFVVLRDPLLLALAVAFEQLFAFGWCSHFLVLLPELPGPHSASCRRFSGPKPVDASSSVPRPQVTLLSNSGMHQYFDMATGVPKLTLIPSHKQRVDLLMGTASARLDRKCILRLGHFRNDNPSDREPMCRIHSYSLHDSDREFVELLDQWWAKHAPNCRGILYDLVNNSSFRNAVKAFADQKKITAERIVDALNERNLGNLLAGLGPYTLILDVVARGELLKYYVRELAGKRIGVNQDVLAAVVKGGATSVKLGSHQVHGFLARPEDTFATPCPQCQVGLPFMPEGIDSVGPMRTFDMLHMADECGWEPEPNTEIPVGGGYPLLPVFGKILERYGPWIGNRLHRTLTEHLFPVDFVVVHPDQADSGALIDCLVDWFPERPPVIAVDHEAIEAAKRDGNWDNVLRDQKTCLWYKQLEQTCTPSMSSALIVDIFLGSGQTLKSLIGLLNYFHITPFACACLVNFRPDLDSQQQSVRIHSLYDWYYPRPGATGEEVKVARERR